MRLENLRIGSLPGLDYPFSLEFRPGINLVVGPNGSGKSSLTRAVFHLLWPGPDTVRPFVVAADFNADGQAWQAAAPDSGTIQWRRDGEISSPPGLPGPQVAASYKLSLLDLTPLAAGHDDRLLARQIRTRMDGGFDLGRTEDDLFTLPAKIGRTEGRKLTDADAKVLEIRNRYAALAQRQRNLASWRQELQQARQAADRAGALRLIIQQRQQQTELDDLKQQLRDFPDGVAAVAAGDPASLSRWRQQEKEAQESLVRLEQELQELEEHQRELDWPADCDGTATIPLLGRKVDTLRAAWDKRAEIRRTLGGLQYVTAAEAPAGDEPRPEPVDRKTFNRLVDLHAALKDVVIRQIVCREELTAPVPSRLAGILLMAGGVAAMVLGGFLLWQGRNLPGFLTAQAGALALGGGTYLLGRRLASKKNRLADELADLDAKEQDLRAQFNDLNERHQLDLDDSHLAHDLKMLSQRLADQKQQDRVMGELAQQEQVCDQALAEVNALLEQAGAAPVGDLDAAQQARDDLDRRAREQDRLAGAVTEAGLKAAGARENLTQAQQAAAEIHEKLSLATEPKSDPEVTRLAGLKPAWEQLRQQIDQVTGGIDQAQRAINEQAHLLELDRIRTLPVSELTQLAEQDAALADRVADLHQDIADLESELKTAQGSDNLETALDRQTRRAEKLAAKRDQARRAALGRLLLGQVREQSETRSRPPVLKQAMDLFAGFTDHAYELLVARNRTDGSDENGDGFLARETETRQVMELGQLSDGTRAQLLLAVRLAFIFQTESRQRPPIFLDESLSSSDPRRFKAVATALGRLARHQERQVIYLTANPADASAWNRALAEAGLTAGHIIDLARQRRLENAAPLEDLAPADIAPIPEPAGQTAAQYGARLQVPVLDPWSPADRAHLYYLLTDDLELLRQLLQAGTPTVGRWRTGRARLVAAGVLTAQQADLLDIRCEIWGALQQAWQVGRGRPVTMEAIDGSGAVSAKMREPVAELLEECRHQAPGFLAALGQGRVKRFQEAKKDQLQAYLELEGFLDSRDILDQDALVQQVTGSLAHRLASGSISHQDLRPLVEQLTSYLDAPPQAES